MGGNAAAGNGLPWRQSIEVFDTLPVAAKKILWMAHEDYCAGSVLRQLRSDFREFRSRAAAYEDLRRNLTERAAEDVRTHYGASHPQSTVDGLLEVPLVRS